MLFADPDAPARIRAELAPRRRRARAVAGPDDVSPRSPPAPRPEENPGTYAEKSSRLIAACERCYDPAPRAPPRPRPKRRCARSISAWTRSKRANDIRVRRAQAEEGPEGREACGSRRSSAIRPSTSSTAKVFDILMAVPKFGRVKAARFLNHVPHQPVEDRRGALRPSARGADWPLQPVARCPSSSSPASRAPARGL